MLQGQAGDISERKANEAANNPSSPSSPGGGSSSPGGGNPNITYPSGDPRKDPAFRAAQDAAQEAAIRAQSHAAGERSGYRPERPTSNGGVGMGGQAGGNPHTLKEAKALRDAIGGGVLFYSASGSYVRQANGNIVVLGGTITNVGGRFNSSPSITVRGGASLRNLDNGVLNHVNSYNGTINNLGFIGDVTNILGTVNNLGFIGGVTNIGGTLDNRGVISDVLSFNGTVRGNGYIDILVIININIKSTNSIQPDAIPLGGPVLYGQIELFPLLYDGAIDFGKSSKEASTEFVKTIFEVIPLLFGEGVPYSQHRPQPIEPGLIHTPFTDSIEFGLWAGGGSAAYRALEMMYRFSNATQGPKSNLIQMDLEFFGKKDLKMVDKAAKQVGVDRNLFGNYIHEVKKAEGMKANQNFTYQQLLDLAEELKNIVGR